MKNCECRRVSECYGGVLGEILCVKPGTHEMIEEELNQSYIVEQAKVRKERQQKERGAQTIDQRELVTRSEYLKNFERQFEVTSDELPPTVNQTLVERGSRYGDFSTHAIIAQDLQTYMRSTPGWAKLSADKKQALTTISDKIARILNGNPEYTDNWHDIAGYAKLAEDRCLTKPKC